VPSIGRVAAVAEMLERRVSSPGVAVGGSADGAKEVAAASWCGVPVVVAEPLNFERRSTARASAWCAESAAVAEGESTMGNAVVVSVWSDMVRVVVCRGWAWTSERDARLTATEEIELDERAPYAGAASARGGQSRAGSAAHRSVPCGVCCSLRARDPEPSPGGLVRRSDGRLFYHLSSFSR